MSAGAPSFPVISELPGWDLFWVRLEVLPGADEAMAALRREVSEAARAALAVVEPTAHPTMAAIRRLFRAAGCDPTRYRPSSESLLRRVLKGEDLPPIHPLVDLNNCLSLDLLVPCSMMSEGTFTPPVTVRAGRPGESYESHRGPFHLEGKPLLADAEGPCAAAVTDSQRVKVRDETRAAWLAAWLPAGGVAPERVEKRLKEMLGKAPVARAG